MAFVPHLRMVASGTFGPVSAPVEIWSWRVNLSDPGTVGISVEDFVNDWAPKVQAFHTDPATGIYQGCILREVKVARIGADGKYTEEPKLVGLTVPGGSSATLPRYAFQTALAVTLESDYYGPRGRGRFYVPGPVHPVNADGLIEASNALGVATAAQTLLNALNDTGGAVPPEPRVTIASQGGKSLVPANHDVTGVRVGRVLDTIRSRRNALQETYAEELPVG